MKNFVIYGKILGDINKKGISCLTVEALDKDLLIDDRLGSAVTDKEGYFEIFYDEKDFQELFFDQKPDIYLQIKNQKGEILLNTEYKIKYEASNVEEININLSEKLIEIVQVEHERRQFKQLLSINPNYFGTTIDKTIAESYQPALFISKQTKYEELNCIGLLPNENLLEAVIEIKKPFGYKGDLCSTGSKEYVSFYIDYNDGAGFVSIGAATSVTVHDLLFVNEDNLYYSVRQNFIPKEHLKCDTPQIVKVRAILSWEQVPTGANYNPVWGNVIERWVQIKPKSGIIFYPMPPLFPIPKPFPFEELEIPHLSPIPPIPPVHLSNQFMITGDKSDIKSLVLNTIEAEEKIKEEGCIEKERFEFSALIMENPNYFGAISSSQDPSEILSSVYNLPASTLELILPELEINPDWLIPVKPILYNTSFEELTCVGLRPEDDLLEAIIEVKKPSGFNGDLCTLGSTQYVAFYIDYRDGAGYQHIATSSIAAHDIPEANNKHLSYAVKATIENITSKLQSCTIENIVKVKAILSWNQDPTPFGHTYTPTWGNALIRNIQIRPKDGASVKCDLEIVNNVHTDDINNSTTSSSKGLAIKIDASGHAVPYIFDRPFGGIIGCWGNVNLPDAFYYRFLYSDDNGTSWNKITNNRIARNPLPWISTKIRTTDSDGWFSVSDYKADLNNYSLTALVHWDSRGKNGDYLLKLEVVKSDYTLLCSDQTALVLDNTGINLFKFGGTPTPLPSLGVVVKDTSGTYKKCENFNGSESIEIFGNFKDDYFSSFSLRVFGGNIAISGSAGIASGRYDTPIAGVLNSTGTVGAFDGGMGTKLTSLNLCNISQTPIKVKCAYGIRLYVSDRAIVGYVRGYEFRTSRHSASAYVTFNWDPNGC
jgi:hypothetical protein